MWIESFLVSLGEMIRKLDDDIGVGVELIVG
jgi:hypothetical protein